jgi:KDO2-lipid IV(A) lauroyltransferase
MEQDRDKKRSRFTDYAVYLVVRVVFCIVQMLPYEMARKLARGLAWLAYKIDKRHRLVADENLRHAYGDTLTPEQRVAMIRGIYAHFCTVLIEIIHLTRRLHTQNWKQYAKLIGEEKIVAVLLSGRPVLIVTGHFGNWEIAGYTLGLLGFHTHAIARTLDNPYLDDFFRSFRERTGQQILAKTGDFENIQGVLAGGGVLATLADQDAGQKGQFVNFFGRPASTHKAVALLALEHHVTILVVGNPFIDGKYNIILSEYIDPAEYQGQRDAIKLLTQRYTSALERVIRVAPEQYFWLHRRWKHQPKERKTKKAA